MFRLLISIVALYIGLRLVIQRRHQATLLLQERQGFLRGMSPKGAERVILVMAAAAFAISALSFWGFWSR